MVCSCGTEETYLQRGGVPSISPLKARYGHIDLIGKYSVSSLELLFCLLKAIERMQC